MGEFVRLFTQILFQEEADVPLSMRVKLVRAVLKQRKIDLDCAPRIAEFIANVDDPTLRYSDIWLDLFRRFDRDGLEHPAYPGFIEIAASFVLVTRHKEILSILGKKPRLTGFLVSLNPYAPISQKIEILKKNKIDALWKFDSLMSELVPGQVPLKAARRALSRILNKSSARQLLQGPMDRFQVAYSETTIRLLWEECGGGLGQLIDTSDHHFANTPKDLIALLFPQHVQCPLVFDNLTREHALLYLGKLVSYGNENKIMSFFNDMDERALFGKRALKRLEKNALAATRIV